MKLRERQTFWWTPEFVCWTDLRKENTLKQGKFWNLKVAAKHNFKVVETQHEPC